jgi:hypothetical protein
MSAAARKRQSHRMKAFWAARRKAKAKSAAPKRAKKRSPKAKPAGQSATASEN